MSMPSMRACRSLTRPPILKPRSVSTGNSMLSTGVESTVASDSSAGARYLSMSMASPTRSNRIEVRSILAIRKKPRAVVWSSVTVRSASDIESESTVSVPSAEAAVSAVASVVTGTGSPVARIRSFGEKAGTLSRPLISSDSLTLPSPSKSNCTPPVVASRPRPSSTKRAPPSGDVSRAAVTCAVPSPPMSRLSAISARASKAATSMV